MKSNDNPMYVNMKSNHPTPILKNIPLAVNRRLSKISANETVFNEAVPPYQNALTLSGYDFKLKYEETTQTRNKPKNRRRQIIWFNPPGQQTVKLKLVQNSSTLWTHAFPQLTPSTKSSTGIP